MTKRLFSTGAQVSQVIGRYLTLMDPNLLRAIKHSFVGKTVRSIAHLAFRLRFDPEKPLLYHVARNLELSLYPQGEVPEFLFLDKSFERIECDLVATYLKPGMNVIDVGANVGLYSILADRLVAPGGKIWAFELGRKVINGC